MAKLPNAPLQEVIFEIRWSLEPSEERGQLSDPGFELATGRLSTIVENKFPDYKRIVPNEIPEHILLYRPIHQYWSADNTWPVLQLGPGIFTINCTEQWYDWETTFRPLIQDAVQWLLKAYKNKINIRFASLTYIDGIKVEDYGGLTDGWQSFIRRNFNFDYNNLFNTRGKQKQIQVNQKFDLEDGSELQIQMSDGVRDNKIAFIWQTALYKKDEFQMGSLFDWADEAHRVAHDLFTEMIKPDLNESFCKTDEDKI